MKFRVDKCKVEHTGKDDLKKEKNISFPSQSSKGTVGTQEKDLEPAQCEYVLCGGQESHQPVSMNKEWDRKIYWKYHAITEMKGLPLSGRLSPPLR